PISARRSAKTSADPPRAPGAIVARHRGIADAAGPGPSTGGEAEPGAAQPRLLQVEDAAGTGKCPGHRLEALLDLQRPAAPVRLGERPSAAGHRGDEPEEDMAAVQLVLAVRLPVAHVEGMADDAAAGA